jgi:hypothetical protein
MATIYLHATRRTVTVGQYVDAVKLAKANPDRQFKHGLSTWWPVTGREIIREFMEGINDRINAHLSRSGRKYSPDWHREMRHAANRLNHPRLIIDGLPAELEGRFSHRLRANMV